MIRWLAFGLWSLVIFALVPFANDLQAWIDRRFGPAALRWALTAALVVAVGVAVRWLVRTKLDGWGTARRLAWILVIAAAAGVWVWRLRVAAEPAHLFSFAVLGVLAFRAYRVTLRDRGVYLAAAALTAIVGTLDEVIQWLVPGRFWDLGDVGINAGIGVLVQLPIWKGIRPADVGPGAGGHSLRIVSRLLAAEAALLLLCLSNTPTRIEWYSARVPGLGYLGKTPSTRMTEYGHRFDEPEIGVFRSRLTLEELVRLDREQGEEAESTLNRYRRPAGYLALARAHPPWREPLLFEARAHLYHRQRFRARAREQSDDEAERRRLLTLAYRENLILERHFPRTLASSGLVWSPEARRQLAGIQSPEMEFESEVSNWLVTAFSESQARWALFGLLAALVIVDRYGSRRATDE